MSDQALNGVKKSLLCELVEQLTTQKNAGARLLFAGCLLSGSFDAARMRATDGNRRFACASISC